MNNRFSEQYRLAEFLKTLSSDFGLVQGFGGNVSYKVGNRMFVKASGRRLGSVDEPHYFHEVRVANRIPFDDIQNQPSRPSIEVFLHALLDELLVIHLHSTRGVALSMLAETSEELNSVLEDSGVVRIKYLRPGKELAKGIAEASERTQTGFYLLENHGILTSANSVSELEDKVLGFEQQAADLLDSPGELAISPHTPENPLESSQNELAIWHANTNWRVTPDHCVFLGPEPKDDVLQALELARTTNDILLYSVTGKDVGPEGEQLGWFYNLAQLLPRVTFTSLDIDEAKFLGSWEAEKFRRTTK